VGFDALEAFVSEAEKTLANAALEYNVSQKDLPLSCPMPNMASWNSHPRVYLPIEEAGQVECPYCSATFKLTDFGEK
jgi:uncharacterized Zn-finger protein